MRDKVKDGCITNHALTMTTPKLDGEGEVKRRRDSLLASADVIACQVMMSLTGTTADRSFAIKCQIVL